MAQQVKALAALSLLWLESDHWSRNFYMPQVWPKKKKKKKKKKKEDKKRKRKKKRRASFSNPPVTN